MLGTRRRLQHDLGREPTVEELAEQMGIRREKVQDVLLVSQEPVSLDAPLGKEGRSCLGAVLEDQNGLHPWRMHR